MATSLAMSMKDKKEEKPASADTNLGALHLGALQMNPQHLGALQMNPNHYGALQVNPMHYGALQMNPHGTFARSFEGAHGAKSPAGYGALHLGALVQQG